MRRFLVLIIAVSLSLSATPFPGEKVRFVYDGDTVLLEGGERLRYLGIDCPELDHENGNHDFMAVDAREFNRRLVQGRAVRLEKGREETDRYGRRLVYVFLEDGRMVNALMVREGLAHVMGKAGHQKYRDLLLMLQQEAISEKRGIWSRDPGTLEKIYMGNLHSLRFHRPDCPFAPKTSPEDTIRFRDRLEAFLKGYSPCRRCRP